MYPPGIWTALEATYQVARTRQEESSRTPPRSPSVLQGRLTRIDDPQVWLPQVEVLCAEAGVALVIEREITGARINGAVRWLASERPLIQLSGRHRWADILWLPLSTGPRTSSCTTSPSATYPA